VRVSAATRAKVLTRCAAPNHARVMEVLPATRRKSTRPAPRSASLTMRSPEKTAPRRTGWPGEVQRKAISRSASTATSESPEVTRCVNSMSISSERGRGSTSPLHMGQWSPHPAPEPVALTKAPQTITARL
jgi:hypothetical protein